VVIPLIVDEKNATFILAALKKLINQVYVNNIRGDGETGFKANHFNDRSCSGKHKRLPHPKYFQRQRANQYAAILEHQWLWLYLRLMVLRQAF
ncbi:MAG: hypothetical protein EZS28_056613, partial [Streblomastix strix]